MNTGQQGAVAPPGWYLDPTDPFMQRWWDGTVWTDRVAPAPPTQPEPSGHDGTTTGPDVAKAAWSPAPTHAKGAALEQQIAAYMSSVGYDVRTNVVLEGRRGGRHEIDVLGEKRDDLSTFRVAVECKAWDQPIEKDVVAKFHYVLEDLGLRQGIIVTTGGSRSGADAAARELGITIWGPDDLRERLGGIAHADLTTQAPRHEAYGLAVRASRDATVGLIEREARGRLGIGGESIVWTSLVWLPIVVVQIALSRTEGRIKKVTQTRRIWNAYDRIDGVLVSSWTSAPPIETVDLGDRSLRPRHRESAFPKAIDDAVKKYRSVSTDAARNRHGQRLASLGLPLGYSIAPETTSAVFTPLQVAIAHRKGAERVIVVDAHTGRVHPRLGASLSQNIHWLRESLS